MQLKSSVTKLSCAVLGSSSLAAACIGLGGTSASAQLVIQSTGTLSGTIQLPSFNPNYNKRITTIDTDSTGTYYRNTGTQKNPNYVPIYKSNYVEVETRSDGSLRYYVDFKGIPVISLNGVLASPALTSGELTAYSYQGKIPGTKFQGVVQDEFGLTKAYYTGTVTDPKTGKQYQGTFEVSGQGPRYSDRNGGESPTVFDFKSDLPGTPTVTSLEMKNSPLVRLTINVPADATPVTTPGGGNTTPTQPPAPVVNNPTTPTPVPNTPVSASVDRVNLVTAAVPNITNNTGGSSVSSPSTEASIEFSSGNSVQTNPVSLEASVVPAQTCTQDSVNCRPSVTASKPAIGPRSRVMIR
jgi:hypothetical protein